MQCQVKILYAMMIYWTFGKMYFPKIHLGMKSMSFPSFETIFSALFKAGYFHQLVYLFSSGCLCSDANWICSQQSPVIYQELRVLKKRGSATQLDNYVFTLVTTSFSSIDLGLKKKKDIFVITFLFCLIGLSIKKKKNVLPVCMYVVKITQLGKCIYARLNLIP